MKKLYSATYKTAVLYEDYRVIVEARNKKEAKILAQAMRICKTDLKMVLKADMKKILKPCCV